MKMIFRSLFLVLIGVFSSNAQEKAIHFEITINGPLTEIWEAWTTKAGIQSFFAPDCNIKFMVDGAYEMYFNPSAKEGSRGGEGNKILALQPQRMFSFTWNAPPHLPEVRHQRTHVTLRFKKENENKTKVILHHDGWGEGGQWDKAYEYFTEAWGKVVLPRLQYRFEKGPVDWKNPPVVKKTE